MHIQLMGSLEVEDDIYWEENTKDRKMESTKE